MSGGPDLMVPVLGTIRSMLPLTHDTQLYEVELEGGTPDYLPGQFYEVSVLGVGECPISITSTPTREGPLEFAIREVGVVTRALHDLEPGAKLGLRGPLGNGFPLDDLRGPLLIAESSFKYSIDGLPGSVNVGAWWSGRRVEAYHEHDTAHEHHGKAWGLYGFWQQLLWRENPADEDCGQGIALFAQYGWAPKDRAEAEDYAGGGIRWQGALPSRDDDVLGMGAFHVRFSDQAGFEDHSETAVELYYKAQVTGWLAVQPDAQFIANPGGDGKRNAVVLVGRVEFIF